MHCIYEKMSMRGTDPGMLSKAKREAIAIIAARPFFNSTILYRSAASGLNFLVKPKMSNPESPGVLVDFPR